MVDIAELPKPELAPNEKRCSRCKEVKDRGEFVRDKYRVDGLKCNCKNCCKMVFKTWENNKRLKTDKGSITCPFCGTAYSNLLSHSIQAHGMNRHDLSGYGVEDIMSEQARKIMSEVSSRPKIKSRKGDYAELGKSRISIPDKFWPTDCTFVKVRVLKDKMQIHFNPANKMLKGVRTIRREKRSHRLTIRIPTVILDKLDIFRPVFEFRKRAGFYIQFFEQDEKLLEPFEFWEKSGHSLLNPFGLTTFSSYVTPKISIADHIWPTNAEYAYLEYTKIKRDLFYLDVIPVSRNGFIVGGKKLDFKQYIGTDNCHKLWRVNNRLLFSFKAFAQQNRIVTGDWDLKEILPSGALRFRLYKERQPRQQQEDIAS